MVDPEVPGQVGFVIVAADSGAVLRSDGDVDAEAAAKAATALLRNTADLLAVGSAANPFKRLSSTDRCE